MTFPVGVGIFETIKTIAGNPIFLKEHLSRASSSAIKMGIPIESEQMLSEKISALLCESEIPMPFGRLRMCFYTNGTSEFDHGEYQQWGQPARLTLSNWIVDNDAPFAGLKTLPYQKNLDAITDARLLGFDEVVRFNKADHICEAATANVLLKIKGRWLTPPTSTGCLPGIIRGFLSERLPILEESILRGEINEIESMFLLSSLREIQPISHVGQRELVIDNSFYLLAAQELAGVR